MRIASECRKVLKKRVGSHDKIEEQRFAIKFTRYEEPIREREREALDAMDGHDNILTRHGYKRYPPVSVCGVRVCARFVLMSVWLRKRKRKRKRKKEGNSLLSTNFLRLGNLVWRMIICQFSRF